MLAAHLVPGYFAAAKSQPQWKSNWTTNQCLLLWATAFGSTVAPDLDVIYNALFRGFINHSVLWTHSLFVYLGVSLTWWLLYRIRRWPYLRTLIGLIAIGGLSHLALDVVSHGTPLLYPLSTITFGVASERVVEIGFWAYVTDPIFLLEPLLLTLAAVHWSINRRSTSIRFRRLAPVVLLSGLVLFSGVFLFLLPTLQSAIERPINANPNVPMLTDLDQGWTKIEPAGDTRCAHNTPYAYWVRPGTTNNVFVYFQGGGGCYNAETCGLIGSYKDAVTDNDNPDNTIGGVFNLNRPENPFRDYTMVFVPYCTGDVHSGNRVETYTSNSGKTFDIYHRGYVNASTALNWIYANFEQPDSIFVTGCSAGSIGSILHTPHIIRHYPQTSVIQLGDSGGGLTSYILWDIDADYDAGEYFPNWIPGMQDEIAHSFTVSKFTIAVANHYPTYTFAQYNAANDRTQRRYFTADGGLEEDFPTALQASLNEIHEKSDNFRSYRADGERHCVLKYSEFYAEETNGVRLQDWVANLANQIEVESVN